MIPVTRQTRQRFGLTCHISRCRNVFPAQRQKRIVPVRFTAEDLKAMEAAAKASDQTISEWVRRASHMTLQSKQLVEQSKKLVGSVRELLSGGRRK